MQQRTLTTGQTQLQQRPDTHVPSNYFDLSHDVMTSYNLGDLIPVAVVEVLPGDEFDLDTQCLTRFAPLVSPAMTRYTQRTEWFYVPYRILWPNSDNFFFPPNAQLGQPAPDAPYATGFTIENRSVGNFMGLPNGAYTGEKISALPFAAYDKIYSDWYRDENTDVLEFKMLKDGDNSDAAGGYIRPNISPYRRQQDKDYFTSAQPFAQKGPAVSIPVSGSATGGGGLVHRTGSTEPGRFYTTDGSTLPAGASDVTINGGSGGQSFGGAAAAGKYLQYDPMGTLTVDPFTVELVAGTIDELRRCVAIQRFLEIDARGGTRAVEGLKGHWDVNQPDYRANRSEYLGRVVQNISIGEVLQTSETASTPQGNQAGHGISVGRSDSSTYKATEYGVIIGISSVIPMTGYYQGLHRMFSRRKRLDYAWPEFANLGEQAILNKEIYFNNSDGTGVNDATFAYTPMYNEYRTMYNRVSGQFRESLDYWVGTRKFGTRPVFNNIFQRVQNDVDTNRIFASVDPSDDHILSHFHHKIKVRRKLPLAVAPAI